MYTVPTVHVKDPPGGRYVRTPRCFATDSTDHLPTWDGMGGEGVLAIVAFHSKVPVLYLLTEFMVLTTKMSSECRRNVRWAERSSLNRVRSPGRDPGSLCL